MVWGVVITQAGVIEEEVALEVGEVEAGEGARENHRRRSQINKT